MKNSLKKRRGSFFFKLFLSIYFLTNNSVCHTGVRHVTNFGYVCDISFISKFLSDFEQGIYLTYATYHFSNLKKETSIHAYSLRSLGSTKLWGSFDHVCDMQYSAM